MCIRLQSMKVLLPTYIFAFFVFLLMRYNEGEVFFLRFENCCKLALILSHDAKTRFAPVNIR